jgi:hypothetical protein
MRCASQLDLLLMLAPDRLAVLAPWPCFVSVAADRLGRQIEIEGVGALLGAPSGLVDQAILDDHGSPGAHVT